MSEKQRHTIRILKKQIGDKSHLLRWAISLIEENQFGVIKEGDYDSCRYCKGNLMTGHKLWCRFLKFFKEIK